MHYKMIRRKIVRIQVWRKCRAARKRDAENKIHRSACAIQRTWKGRQERRVYDSLKQTIHLAQQRWRMHYAKSQLKKLKAEAREVGAILAKNQQAQQQVAELKAKTSALEVSEIQLQAEKKT